MKNHSTADHPSKPEVAGEGAGGVSGAMVGATVGTIAGPLGSIIGGLAGAAGGWWLGRNAVDAVTHTDREDETYREDYTKRGLTTEYDRIRPAYQVGHLAALNPDYSGKRFDDIDPVLSKSWADARDRDGLPEWSEVRDSARYSYERQRQDREVTRNTNSEGLGDSPPSSSR